MACSDESAHGLAASTETGTACGFFPCTTLAVGAVHVTPGRFRHAEEVANVAATAKHETKQTATGLVLPGMPAADLNMLVA